MRGGLTLGWRGVPASRAGPPWVDVPPRVAGDGERMTLRERLFDDSSDRGVSPVIGVILMVAITVILATVIGAVVLDFGNSAGDSAPSASLDVDVNSTSDGVVIEHTGGDSLSLDQTRILVDDTSGSQSEFSSGSGTFSVGDRGALDGGSTSGQGDLSSLSGSNFDTASGGQITITIIDTESQRQIYKTTVTVP